MKPYSILSVLFCFFCFTVQHIKRENKTTASDKEKTSAVDELSRLYTVDRAVKDNVIGRVHAS